MCAGSVKPQNLIPLSKSDKRAYLMQFCSAFNMTCLAGRQIKKKGREKGNPEKEMSKSVAKREASLALAVWHLPLSNGSCLLAGCFLFGSAANCKNLNLRCRNFLLR